MNETPSRLRRGIAALVLTGAALALAGCAGSAAAPGGSATPQAAVLEKIDADLSRLTLTPEAVERLGLTTVPVQDGPDGGLTIPYAALIYDHGGDTWVYTNPEGHDYVRAAVDVQRIEGDTVHLSAGPAAGTAVVTLGTAELYGAEFDTGH